MFIDPKGNKICEVAVRHNFLSQELAQKCLEQQAKDTASGFSRKMGSYLIEVGGLSKDDLKKLLEIIREQRASTQSSDQTKQKRKRVARTTNCPHCKEIILKDSLECVHCSEPIKPIYEDENNTYLTRKKKKAPPKQWPIFKIGCFGIIISLATVVFLNAGKIKTYVAQFVPKIPSATTEENGDIADPDNPSRHKAFDLVDKLKQQLNRDIDTKKDSLRSGDLKRLLEEKPSNSPRTRRKTKSSTPQNLPEDSHDAD